MKIIIVCGIVWEVMGSHQGPWAFVVHLRDVLTDNRQFLQIQDADIFLQLH